MKTFQHSFVEFIPDYIEEGILYISIKYHTAVHKCACGCGSEIVTPISPTDWRVTYNGETTSLYPSIGNWGLECKSHYWIENDKVIFARSWSEKEIEQGRNLDKKRKNQYFSKWKKRKK
ncbi:MAG: hypothetical protein H6551_10040 [Chitinophagales bacterium]|nr:hypothetical protein [Chitinophagales bacterium]